MASYDVLRDDLGEEEPPKQDKKPSKKKYSSSGNKSKKRKFNLLKRFKIGKKFAFKIHLVVVLLVVLALLFYFMGAFSETSEPEIILEGSTQNFTEEFKGDLLVYSSEFSLKTGTGKFDSADSEILLKGSSGKLKLKDNGIIFKGSAEEITYGKNSISLDGGNFTLYSPEKTEFDMDFSVLNLTLTRGKVKIGETLQHEFEDTTVYAEEFNSTLYYEEDIRFEGDTKNIRLNSPDEGLNIEYTR